MTPQGRWEQKSTMVTVEVLVSLVLVVRCKVTYHARCAYRNIFFCAYLFSGRCLMPVFTLGTEESRHEILGSRYSRAKNKPEVLVALDQLRKIFSGIMMGRT